MKLFKCDAAHMTFSIVDLPRRNWHVLPPRKWQIALTVATIIVGAILWGLL